MCISNGHRKVKGLLCNSTSKDIESREEDNTIVVVYFCYSKCNKNKRQVFKLPFISLSYFRSTFCTHCKNRKRLWYWEVMASDILWCVNQRYVRIDLLLTWVFSVICTVLLNEMSSENPHDSRALLFNGNLIFMPQFPSHYSQSHIRCHVTMLMKNNNWSVLHEFVISSLTWHPIWDRLLYY